jgi:hypothetical protein
VKSVYGMFKRQPGSTGGRMSVGRDEEEEGMEGGDEAARISF